MWQPTFNHSTIFAQQLVLLSTTGVPRCIMAIIMSNQGCSQVEADGHDDEVRSHGSSASSSPRYPAAVLSHLAASMTASNRQNAMAGAAGACGMQRLANNGGQQYGVQQYGGHQQPVYGFGPPQPQQQQHTRVPHVSSPQDGPRMASGSPAYMPATHLGQGYGAQRGMATGSEGYGAGYGAGWSQQGV